MQRHSRVSKSICRGIGSRDSAVGIATTYELNDRGVGVPSPGRVKNFLVSTSFRPTLGPTQPHIEWVPGTFTLGVKRPGREADHSPPTSVEVKKTWVYISTSPYVITEQLSTGTTLLLPLLFTVYTLSGKPG
jgi:hypothetical protein